MFTWHTLAIFALSLGFTLFGYALASLQASYQASKGR